MFKTCRTLLNTSISLYRWVLTELSVCSVPVSAVTQAWPSKWIKPESLLTLWVRTHCYWSTDITAGALGQTQRHKSNYENKPTQLSQLRTLRKASFDEWKCTPSIFHLRLSLRLSWWQQRSLFERRRKGEWARVAHKAAVKVMWHKQSEVTRPQQQQQPTAGSSWGGNERVQNGLDRKWEMWALFRLEHVQ